MILVVADNFLSAFPPIDSLLSPEDSAASFELPSATARKLSPENQASSPSSPIKPTNLQLDIKLVMDGAAGIKHHDASPTRNAYQANSPARMPPPPLSQQHSNERETEPAIAKFSVKIASVID